MIKGVGRYAVEVESVDSEFFERVICFVRPQYACGSGLDLHREAVRVADCLSAEVEDAQHGSRHVLRSNAKRRSSREAALQAAAARQACPSAELPPRPRGGWLPLVLSAGGGAAAAMIIAALL